MNLLAKFLGRTLENPATPLGTPDDWLVQALGGGESSSGIRINTEIATTYAAVFRAVGLISGDVGKMPLILYKRNPEGGKLRAPDHPASALLKKKPNPEQTAFEFKRLIQVHALLTGNGYAFILRSGTGVPLELWPMAPDAVSPVREDRVLWYFFRPPSGEPRKIPAADVIHIKGFGFDGLQGYSFTAKATESLGYGLAMRKYGSVFFKGSARPSVILEYPGTLAEPLERELRQNWNRMHQGLDMQHRTAVLQRGITAKVLPSTARDAQLQEMRAFEIREIANFFGLPPHKLGDPTRTSLRSLEAENQTYLSETLDSWLVGFEQECNAKLLTEEEKRRDSHFFEFLRESLIKIDIRTRTETQVKQVNNGLLSLDEARAQNNLPPLPNGEGAKFRIPLNIGIIGEVVPKGQSNSNRASEPKPDKLTTVTLPQGSIDAVIAAAFERMNSRIALAAARAAKHPARFIRWVEDIESDHRVVVEASLRPALALIDVNATSFVNGYFLRIYEGLLSASECQADELLDSVTRWGKQLNSETREWLGARKDRDQEKREMDVTLKG